MRARMDELLDATEKGFEHARRAGLDNVVPRRAAARFFGTTPVTELLAWLGEHEAREFENEAFRRSRAGALAMLGRADEARVILTQLRADLADRGAGVVLGTMMGQDWAVVELVAGDPEAAVDVGMEGCRLLDELGEKGFLSTAAGNLGQAWYALDRLDEADTWSRRAEELGASEDVLTQMLWRQVHGKVLARRGDREEAERLARDAVELGGRTDMLNQQGETYADLGEVLLLVGKPAEAADAFEQALERFERKGNLVSAERMRSRLADGV